MTIPAPSQRSGSGPPLVCLHGFMDSWRTWDLVRPALERHHEVLAPALVGHVDGPPVPRDLDMSTLADAVERQLDEAGIVTADLVGNSLGGYVVLQLAARGRARSVVAFAPAGGWAADDEAFRETLALQARSHEQLQAIASSAYAIASTPEGRRRATQLVTVNFEHLPADLVAHQIQAAARCQAPRMLDVAMREGYPLDAERVTCPLRIVWGTDDRLLPWPATAERYRRNWFPQADWIELDGVGHSPQLDVPLEAAQLILGFTAPGR